MDLRPIVIEPALSSSVRKPSFSLTSRLRLGLFLDEPDPDESTALKATTPSSKGRIAGIFQQEWPGALSLSRTIPHYPEACPKLARAHERPMNDQAELVHAGEAAIALRYRATPGRTTPHRSQSGVKRPSLALPLADR